MFRDYAFKMMCAMSGLSAVLAYALARVMPDTLAAIIAVIGSITWGYFNDEVMKNFRTDVERILQPNEPAKAAMAFATSFAIFIVVMLARQFGAVIAAAMGPILFAFIMAKTIGQ